jgi:hypothetical protein
MSGMLVAVAVGALLVMFHQFGYWEFIRRHFSVELRRHYRLYNLEAEVTALKMEEAESFEDLWSLLLEIGEDYSLHTVRIEGEEWERSWTNPEAEGQPEQTARDLFLGSGGLRLHVSHNGGKDEDIELEQNLLLEKVSKTLARELIRVEEEPREQSQTTASTDLGSKGVARAEGAPGDLG